jgi:transposase
VERLRQLRAERGLRVALEPSGTYGDALRQALTDAGLEVRRVSPKAAHDYAEVFDGVPSQHDGKDAAIVAELSALGKSAPWPWQPLSAWDQELAYEVDWIDAQHRTAMMWYGRLEGLLARHWPELTVEGGLEISSATLLLTLQRYGGPAALVADVEAAQRLARWGRGRLPPEKIARLLSEASRSVGVRQTPIDVARMQRYAGQAWAARREVQQSLRKLARLAQGHAILEAQGKAVGMATACVLWAHLGDPRDYSCGAAYRKAMGLNLKERSSGQWQGRLTITKRGHPQVRRWLFFAALRAVQRPAIRRWYEAQRQREPSARRALVGVMRRLALALHRVGVEGVAFDPWRLFPGIRRPASSANVQEVSMP